MQNKELASAVKQTERNDLTALDGRNADASNKAKSPGHTDAKELTAAQDFNESLIKLLVLLYQIDGKVTLTEQDLFDDITASLYWRSGVSISSFVTDAIHQARVAIDQKISREFLFALGPGLNVNPAQALEYAMDITEIDGKRSDEELELLALLSNRVLARGLDT
jgi:hypothetical protein